MHHSFCENSNNGPKYEAYVQLPANYNGKLDHQCDFTTCTLYEQGCKTPNSQHSKVQMQQTSPYSFTVPQDLKQGWEETKCIVCQTENPDVTMTFDGARIKQFPDISYICGWNMVKFLPPLANKWYKG